MSFGLVIVLFLVLAAEFINGWTDAPNAIATVVSTRVMSPRTAVIMATVLNAAGAFAGTAVAATIGKGIVDPAAISLTSVAAAVSTIVMWGMFAAHFGLPVSKSHALVSGLAGAGLAMAGPKALLWAGWRKVLIGMGISTFVGFFLAMAIASTIRKLWGTASPAPTQRRFSQLQIASAALMAFTHGSNDGQKFIGVFTLTLMLGGVLPTFVVPFWVVIICALVMGLGTSVGGAKIIRTMGMRMVELQPWQGFSAETAAGIAIISASHMGMPLSTTHTITTAVMGVGASRRLSAVRWSVVREIVLAWALTFPICGLVSFLLSLLLDSIF